MQRGELQAQLDWRRELLEADREKYMHEVELPSALVRKYTSGPYSAICYYANKRAWCENYLRVQDFSLEHRY